MKTLCLMIYEENPHENPARILTCPPDMSESEFRTWAKRDFVDSFEANIEDLDTGASKWIEEDSSGILVFHDGSQLIYEVVYASLLRDVS